MKRGDSPAYPLFEDLREHGTRAAPGMTIRERVAMAAMQGVKASEDSDYSYQDEDIAERSFDIADAWLAEAEKRREK